MFSEYQYYYLHVQRGKSGYFLFFNICLLIYLFFSFLLFFFVFCLLVKKPMTTPWKDVLDLMLILGLASLISPVAFEFILQ